MQKDDDTSKNDAHEDDIAGAITTGTKATIDQPLGVAIRNRTRAIGFNRYNQFINSLLGITKPCCDID